MADPSHRSDARILRRRTLQRDHRCLVPFLQPGFAVLDVGCGTGAITAGIARAVGPHGRVTGVDRDQNLLEQASAEHAALTNLRFVRGEATNLPFRAGFDVVTAARTLQWTADPAGAIRAMREAAKPGGMLVLLDYNHTDNAWTPDPPGAFRRFYAALLAWRTANGWDNRMGEHLPGLLRAAGLVDVRSSVQDEITTRGDPDFGERTELWQEVIDTLGPPLVRGGYCNAVQLGAARDRYTDWVGTSLLKQTLELRAATGRVPSDSSAAR